ncbi:hypothetical protein KBTX_03562 [wastewater metagenome]|uniref:Type IV pilin Tt1218-like domain-containing protein n=2 Tax=unclassified sequences TaxID=12908 RepID=A0A5B8RI49_9ZZZZ|nr:type IV pilus modification protein PilV [Arhodomonas sp. KWT]QEA07214.1 hypothetical protein KBTEX_03562 [uncultured organism]
MTSHASERQTGLSMVEVLITVLVLSIGLLGVAGLNLQALKANTDSMKRSQVIWLVDSLAEQMHANSEGVYEYFSGSTPRQPLKDGNNKCNAPPTSNCTSDGCRTFRDTLWRVACDASLGADASGIAALPGSRLNIECNDVNGSGSCNQGDTFEIEAAWRYQGGDGKGNDADDTSRFVQAVVP